MVYDGFLYSETSNVNQALVMEEEKPKEKKPLESEERKMEEEKPKEKKPLESEERNLKFPESFNGEEASNAG